jgi:prolyl 4-hydroxylase
VERVADLFQFGYGVERNDAKAFSIYQQLCAWGFPHVLCQTAYMLSRGMGCESDEVAASTLLLQAAARGDLLALHLLGLRFGAGLGVGDDPIMAVALLQQTASQEFPGAHAQHRDGLAALDPGARTQADELAQQLAVGLAKVAKARDELAARVPEHDPAHAQAMSELLDREWPGLGLQALSFDPEQRGAKPSLSETTGLDTQSRCWSPRVFTIEGFADAEERAFLLAAASPSLMSGQQAAAIGPKVEIDAFDGDCAVFSPHRCSPVIRNLQRRWASVLHVHEQHFEPMSVLRYQPGHEYSPHVDYFDGARMSEHHKIGDYGAQRIITALIYLIVPEEGGETDYPVAQTRIEANPGTAVIHYNATPDGLGDPNSLHHGRPIVAGEKWIARTAVREKNLYLDLYTEI